MSKPARGMVRYSLFLEEKQLERLKEWSDVTHAPLADLIRRAINKGLDAVKAEDAKRITVFIKKEQR